MWLRPGNSKEFTQYPGGDARMTYHLRVDKGRRKPPFYVSIPCKNSAASYIARIDVGRSSIVINATHLNVSLG